MLAGIDLWPVRDAQDCLDPDTLVANGLPWVLGGLTHEADRVEENVVGDRLAHVADNQGRGIGEGNDQRGGAVSAGLLHPGVTRVLDKFDQEPTGIVAPK